MEVDEIIMPQMPDPAADTELESRRLESEVFIGRWNRLVSQTNWEKGAIIVQWRTETGSVADDEPARSDEVWSRLVGGVSPQHVGRLRRTWQRFGATASTYPGLYWSHFYAALDWDDAEMWLEGAVREGWSVSRMRTRRWETLGGDAGLGPDPAGRDLVTTEIAEENHALATEARPARSGEFSSEPLDEGPDFGPAEMKFGESAASPATVSADPLDALAGEALFTSLAGLPPDVADAVESLQLCIIRHRGLAWREISSERMVALLEALQRLARSSSDAHGNEPDA